MSVRPLPLLCHCCLSLRYNYAYGFMLRSCLLRRTSEYNSNQRLRFKDSRYGLMSALLNIVSARTWSILTTTKVPDSTHLPCGETTNTPIKISRSKYNLNLATHSKTSPWEMWWLRYDYVIMEHDVTLAQETFQRRWSKFSAASQSLLLLRKEMTCNTLRKRHRMN